MSFAAAMVIGGGTPHAHHSISGVYDSSRRVTIEGAVTQFLLVNPHPFLIIDVTDGTGRARQWRLEMDNRSELAAIGVTANTFTPGDRVVVTGSLARTRGESMYLLRLDRPAFADSQRIHSRGTEWPQPITGNLDSVARKGTQKLACELTLREGKVVYDLNGITRPDWDKLPRDYKQTGDTRWDALTPAPVRRNPGQL